MTPDHGPIGAPVLLADDLVLADLELVLDGVALPFARLGGDLHHDQAPTPDGRLIASLPAEQVAVALDVGAVVIADRERTPLAVLTEVDAAPGGVSGVLQPLRVPERGPYRRLRRPPAARAGGPPRRVVVTGRPVLPGDLRPGGALADLPAASGEVLVLVPVSSATPDGVPPETLLPAVRSALPAAAAWTLVAVPLAFRDPATDAALVRALAQAHGASTVTHLGSDDAGWSVVLGQLDRGRGLTADVGPAVARHLLRWRPDRAHRGLVVLFTGLSGSGKSTLARGLTEFLREETDRTVSTLDGDDVRRLLSAGLGFDRAARDVNVHRIGYVASEVARHGGVAVCAPIAPYAASRAAVRRMAEDVGDFVLVHVSTPIEECERRDLKGMYAKARAGLLTGFTGVDDPYETPEDADVTVDTSGLDPQAALDLVLSHLRAGGWLRRHVEEG